jgi:CRISPR-associated protein Cmr2
MTDDNDQNKALLSFFLGPVQPFIEAARTVRDLWTGSYLLAWLTAHAMKPIIDQFSPEVFVSPDLNGNPLMELLKQQRGSGEEAATTPCLPNTFIALLPSGADGRSLATACESACRTEWRNVAQATHRAIERQLRENRAVFQVTIDGTTRDLTTDWDRLWANQVAALDQIDTFFEIRTVVMPVGTTDNKRNLFESPPESNWLVEMDTVGGLLAARKSVRHVPPYRPSGEVAQKCFLLGSFEQMGPASLKELRAFWDQFAESVRIGRTRTRKAERLCAVSLTKRFAWGAYLANRLGLTVDDLPYADTATVAASCWLPPPGDIPGAPPGSPDEESEPALDWRRLRRWSGQWLHWSRPDQEKDERPCPEHVWRWIQSRKRALGKPPTYYAILLLDGDFLSEKLQRSASQDRSRAVSRCLTQFALNVAPGIVRGAGGTLIYAGGDDLLAMLPAATVTDCARRLSDAYRRTWAAQLGEPATVSAGIAVVHIKEDLRFALQTVRDAEKTAKRIGDGRKDALALTICRRSGEHTTAVMAWPHTDSFGTLVEAFRKHASDRWVYKLCSELPTLSKLPWPASAAIVKLLLGRAQGIPDALPDTVQKFMQGYYDEMITRRGREGADSLTDFAVLCQSASFLARGRD